MAAAKTGVRMTAKTAVRVIMPAMIIYNKHCSLACHNRIRLNEIPESDRKRIRLPDLSDIIFPDSGMPGVIAVGKIDIADDRMISSYYRNGRIVNSGVIIIRNRRL